MSDNDEQPEMDGRAMGETEDVMNETAPSDPRRSWITGAAVAAVLAVLLAIVLNSGDDTDDASGSVGTVPAGETTSVVATSDGAAGGTIVESTPTTGSATGTTDVADGDAPASTAPASTVPTVTVPVITGSLDTVVVDTVLPAPPVAMDDVADAGTGMTFRVEQLEAVEGEAAGPGEIAAPAVRVTVVATNGGTEPVLMQSVVVDLTAGDDAASAPPLSGPGVERFVGELAPGASATGVYVFDVPIERRGRVAILVSYLASVSPVVFEGSAPTS